MIKDLTDYVLPHAAVMDAAFVEGYNDGFTGRRRKREHVDNYANTRGDLGLRRKFGRLTTPGEANRKLDGASVYTIGLTIDSYVQRIDLGNGVFIVLNACPNAGHCVKVCVVKNGNGRYSRVQEAWRIRSTFLCRHPESFAYVLGWELGEAARKHDKVLFRPNVNSDVAWQRLIPSAFDGVTMPTVKSYGYSKRPETLKGDGQMAPTLTVAYSWNETSKPRQVRAFQQRGGNVAVVTSRKKGTPVGVHFPFGTTAMAADADKTDEWMFERGIVGDLSAKGKARSLIGKSGFVVTV
jgi:hypothetical protein